MGHKKSVLVVEDEVLIADSLCTTLGQLGYEVLEPALSYRDAIHALEREHVDLAILDIHLGGKKTGFDIANYIKERGNIPFIYLTSYSDTKTIELAKQTLPYAYLVKPFDPTNVMTAIEIALNNSARFDPQNSRELTGSIPSFTDMEKVVLKQIKEGMTSKEIADKLCVSISTVKNHRHNITTKIGLSTKTHSLVNWVMQNKELI